MCYFGRKSGIMAIHFHLDLGCQLRVWAQTTTNSIAYLGQTN